ncbi:MAG: hypothetical protein H8E66_13370, partial [Planctomycetes bacterium]|nr:hypothetical protein [Planctomycetota bacterium]
LLLLVGESGHDQRITQLIAAVANDTKATSSDLNVIWVTSNPLPPAAQRVCMSGTVCVARYFDCELFLQELYYRSATAFPATTNTYAALPPYPPARIDGDVIELSQKKTASLPINVAYLSQDNDPSVELSRIAASFNPSCKRVWMDCDAVTSGEELFENMAWQLRRYDPELLPALLVSVAKTRWPTDRDICVELLKRATKRDDYLFVVNSLETEATSNASAPERNGAMEFVDVVQKLVHDDDGLLNDSQILLGIINGDTSRRAEKRTEITAHAEIWDQPARTDSSILLEKVSCLVDARRREKCAASIRALEQEEPDLQSVEGVGKLLTILWPYLNSKQTAILILIGAFRRFPNILLIRNRVAGLWTMLREAHLGELGVLEMLSDHSAYRRYDRFVHTLSMPSGWQQSKEIDEQLDALVAAGILVRHEGGYMRMPQAIKNWVNEKLFKDAGDGLANLHDLIASAYYDYSFLQSSDIKIFFEYVYHRVESARYTISATTMQRLQVLVPCLRQIRDLALTQGHGAKLARILRQVRTSDVPAIADSLDASIAPPEGEQLEAITAGLEEIEAEVYLKRMDFGAAIAIRQTRLLRVAAALSDSPGKSWIETIATSEPTRSVDSEGQALSTWLPKLLKERPREATALLQNIYEFALAQSGLRQFKIAERLFCELADVCSSIAWDHSSNRHGGREPIARLAIQAEHRKMALHLEQVSIWKFDAGAQLSISEACHAFERAEQWLLQYYTNYVAESELGSNAENSFYVLYKCFLNSLRCRVACLRAIRRCSNLGPATRAEGQEAALREFRLARGFLDLAYALAQRKECTAQTRSARTICRIIEAEMLILYSDVIVQRERGYNKARRILENAEKLLESAADSLGSGNRHLGWWTWLLLLRAQLQHELLALALTDVTMWSEASLRTLFQNGLDAVSAGLVTTAEDDVRRQSFQVLWWQFFACHHVQVRSQRPRSKGRSIQERWKQLNDASGLTWYCDAVESRGILDAFVEQLEWEMPDEPLLRRSWLIQCEKSAIDRLGIQLFLMTGHNA